MAPIQYAPNALQDVLVVRGGHLSQWHCFPQYLLFQERVEPLIGDYVHRPAECAFEILNQASRKPATHVFTAVNQKVNIALRPLFRTHDRTKDPQVVSAMPLGDGNQFTSSFFELTQCTHLYWHLAKLLRHKDLGARWRFHTSYIASIS